ncbi:MAG TPA: flagellar hook-basal body complex protein FliE [Anaerohalosphaeraceae bacterium]|jgi:flagellar hook-basal body complex protein FliE|nr:flagellar hook-basal body complex protein FliE [Anaerohalosphaeraceae bacterium]HRT49437.1 flagellar hook-basal body complex protein FliE [Anaerohalosphaeraceae bacterium]HRT85399.1 flagellar hook-basal body complex protein FliE [Anaerohalosphaeraceae bacterium]
MAINFDPRISPLSPGAIGRPEQLPRTDGISKFSEMIGDSLKRVDDKQQDANTSIVDLLAGKNEDINSVVASVAKADMSFKLLVGVRNKLVEAYKETMRMPI